MPKRKRVDDGYDGDSQRNSVEVIAPRKDEVIPFCSHGPCLLFERYLAEGRVEQFFACSVSRDRKICCAYIPRLKSIRPERQELMQKLMRESLQPKHSVLSKRLKEFKAQKSSERKFCSSCNVLLLKTDYDLHREHTILSNITDEQLKRPSSLLSTLNEKNKEAQYWFSNHSVKLFRKLIRQLKYDSVLCIGAPRIHEDLCTRRIHTKSFLLDIDYRYAQFWHPSRFACYNMCVDYFYNKLGEKFLKRFLEQSRHLLIVIDPPFGCMIEPVSNSIKKLLDLVSSLRNNSDLAGCDLAADVTWAFPYFMEKRILESMPDMSMLDYKVTYTNHSLFKCDLNQNSPIRLFTTIKASSVDLPTQDGYRFCIICQRYVSAENKHCASCNSCTTKHGPTYAHCNKCKRCVKPSFKHCVRCHRCHSAVKGCVNVSSSCSLCHSSEHKRKSCPNRTE